MLRNQRPLRIVRGANQMIIRIWHGTTPAEKADAYSEYLQQTGLPGYRGTPGNLGMQFVRKVEGDRAEFLTISWWESYEAIRGFTGDDISRAVYYSEDDEFLLEREPTVAHYEVFVDQRGE
jgi:heme-degrading monooxygenase HmoA